MAYYNFPLNKKSPIYQQVYQQIKEQIILGEMPAGTKLLPERQLSEKLHVHRNTIIRAYSELKAEDLIVARQGQGYFVNYGFSGDNPSSRSQGIYWPGLLNEEVCLADSTFDSHVFQSYRDRAPISFTQSAMPSDYYSRTELKELFSNAIKNEDLFGYTPHQGRRDLRKCLSHFLGEKGIRANANDIVVFSDESRAFECTLELLLQTGDSVIMEEPYSPQRYKQAGHFGARIQTCPVDQDGMMTQLLEPMVQKYHPKLIITSGSFNEPVGSAKTLERKKMLLEISYRYNIPILEENWASDLCYSNSCTSLISIDQKGHTLYLHSFGLTCAPGMKAAFLTGPKDFIEPMCRVLAWKDIDADNLAQTLLCAYIKSGLYDRTIEMAVIQNSKKRDLVCQKLEPLRPYGVSANMPIGGICVWCALPETINVDQVLKLALKEGVSLSSGDAFFYHQASIRPHIKINYAFPDLTQVKEGMDRLVKVLMQILQE